MNPLARERRKCQVMKNIDRRQFLKQGAVALGSAFAFPLTAKVFDIDNLQVKNTPRKIIIIGAGLAGLSAGYELAQLGHEVIIIEARMRPGGRVSTIREPFSDGLYAEAGAQFVPESHELTMKYVKLFNLSLIPLSASEKPSVYFARGKRFLMNDDKELNSPFELTAEERKLGIDGMLKKYIDPVLQEITDAADPNFPPEQLKKYDRQTMTGFLRGRGASAGAIELFRMGYLEINGDGIDSYSALSGLRDLILGHAEKEFKIKGGSDLLPKAFAERMADKIFYGSPVVRIEHEEKSVRVSFTQAGSPQTLSADQLICAIPFSILKKIEVSPRFSPEKQKAVEQLSYTSVARVYLQMRRKFWQNENISGELYLDNPRMEFYPLGHSGKRDIYESFITGRQARVVASMRESERLSYVLEHAQKALTGVRENFEGGASKCWDEDEWARGAWAWFKPGETISLTPHISRAEGRIHFAGEHASAYPGWMQGAFESGNRVAKEIHEAK